MQRIHNYWVVIRSFLLRMFSYVPLFGALPDTSWNNRKEAFSELCISQIISSMPIWLGGARVCMAALESGQIF